MKGSIYEALTLIVPLVLAIVFHEVAHGLMARRMGDPTAAERRRLSLNPLRHGNAYRGDARSGHGSGEEGL